MDGLHTFGLFIGSLLANTLASLSGGGAGLIQFPLLIFLGLPFSVALATHKVASVALGLGAAIKYIRAGKLNRSMTAYVMIAGTLGVILGANAILFVPGRIAEAALGLLILGLGLYSLYQPGLGKAENSRRRDHKGLMLGSLGLAAIGIVNGSLTAGSGLFVTLFLIRWFGYDYRQAVALTLISVGLFWNGTGAVAMYAAGADIYWPWLPILIAGSLLGGYLGAHLAGRQSNRLIKRCFEALTFLIGAKLLFGL
ncbi:sulfite exporter TauE/SafE family protein [Photobacterium galatheae]|uniref:Probable membrane transporter protein n=1 Tax=Photobacterium galatheae TaxID=1654360 RepID=A0A066RZ30_9GAMM|nr:sulfite exporter TauE/SafE family protein [Photobacterium galatheae]KDM92957.1 permease [Photobacterium galatheae]MCM0148515.1 sulfite exporter TauE/SafE family protein [Photobacterium galatheae]